LLRARGTLYFSPRERRWVRNRAQRLRVVRNQPNSFDVVVLGGGPGGLATALTLRRYSDLSVLVVEKSRYDLPRVGETLAPGIRGLLEYLGVWEAFLADGHLPSFGTAAAWGSSAVATRDFILTPLGNGWHLDRRRFDQTMASQAEAAGVAVWQAAHADFEPLNEGRWRLDVLRGGERHQPVAGFLVDATGKTALVARHIGVKRRIVDRLVAVTATLELPGRLPSETLTLVETCEHGWWYSARLPGGSMTVALMSDTDIIQEQGLADPEQWWRLLQHQPHTSARVTGARLAGHSRIVPAFSASLDTGAGPGWAAVGDAAASHDPLSSSGIARALDSGIHAARAVYEFLRGGRPDGLGAYDRRLRESFDLYWEIRQRYYDLEQRWPQSLFWHRRQSWITIDPHSRVERTEEATYARSYSVLPGHLRQMDSTLLFSLCAAGRPVHQIVEDFQQRAARPVADYTVVLALQCWLRGQILKVVG
jgi:flavin-dependent dehydrogenase